MPVTYISAVLRRQVYNQAQGHCEYCLIPESLTYARHEIDHVISRKHRGPTIAENLALSCVLCNKLKGSDIASVDSETGMIVPLYHPRRDNWQEHFQIQKFQIIGLTPSGRATVRLLKLNSQDRIAERKLLIAEGMINSPERG